MYKYLYAALHNPCNPYYLEPAKEALEGTLSETLNPVEAQILARSGQEPLETAEDGDKSRVSFCFCGVYTVSAGVYRVLDWSLWLNVVGCYSYGFAEIDQGFVLYEA